MKTVYYVDEDRLVEACDFLGLSCEGVDIPIHVCNLDEVLNIAGWISNVSEHVTMSDVEIAEEILNRACDIVIVGGAE